MNRYGLRTPKSMVPCVEVVDTINVPATLVTRRYGITHAHAIRRALRWMRKH